MNRFAVNHFRAGSGSKFKASLVERVIRTLKTRLERYFQKTKSVRWIDVLEKFVDDYNKTPHSKIGLAPNQVTEKTAKAVYNKMYPYKGVIITCKLNLGDKVRILLQKMILRRATKSRGLTVFISSLKSSNQTTFAGISFQT